jgi:hypothetical protein
MFVCQPPCGEMILHISEIGKAREKGSIRILNNVNGITIGQVVKRMTNMRYYGKWTVGRTDAFAMFSGLPVTDEDRER